jgi:hypothetical protein
MKIQWFDDLRECLNFDTGLPPFEEALAVRMDKVEAKWKDIPLDSQLKIDCYYSERMATLHEFAFDRLQEINRFFAKKDELLFSVWLRFMGLVLIICILSGLWTHYANSHV